MQSFQAKKKNNNNKQSMKTTSVQNTKTNFRQLNSLLPAEVDIGSQQHLQ